MNNSRQYVDNFNDLVAQFQERLADELGGEIAENPRYVDAINQRVDQFRKAVADADAQTPPQGDSGLNDLLGLSEDAPTEIRAPLVRGIEEYDEQVTSDRILAVADLYYIYQHERIGVFKVVRKLKELFEAGSLRLSGGRGAIGLYRFDRRQVLRYTQRDRLAAYRRVLGYGNAPVPKGAHPNAEFHPLFAQFVNEVAQFWRDKRISDVIRERAFDPSFGSIATVRRAGLDLRNNLKWASYGHINVLRLEVMNLLQECFQILNADDIRQQFGSENGWDVVEEVLTRYFNAQLETSPRQRMAVTGRNIMSWVGQPFILKASRPQFEALLGQIAGDAEEWVTSAETLGLADRRAGRSLPWDGRSQSRVARQPALPMRRRAVAVDRAPVQQEYEYEYEL